VRHPVAPVLLAIAVTALAGRPGTGSGEGAGAPPAAARAPGEGTLDQLTLEEKASLVTGQTSSKTRAVQRLGIPSVWLVDGPVGLRKRLGPDVEETVPATCFPSAAAIAATWNPDLVQRVGAAIGAEARSHGVGLLLAPGLNIKRHPLGGRNFEYYSEDPRLAGTMAAAFVRGVQSQGVGATLKHFVANNQEHRRMSIDVRVSERALREIYLRSFEIALARSSPQAVMSAYNRVNGTPASQSRRLLTGILRNEWGFDGLVVSDWGAVDDPVAAIRAGLDLEMPANRSTPAAIVAAVECGELDEAVLDRAVGRVLQLVDRRAAKASLPTAVDLDRHHDLAREVAVESMVLLENRGFLPLEDGAASSLGIVGRLAAEPRIQGIGSSRVNPTRVDAPLPFLVRSGAASGFETSFWGRGYSEDGLSESEKGALASFLELQDVLVIFAGQRASQDSEARDRATIRLAPAELQILEAVRASRKPFAVVLVGGGAIDVGPFAKEAAAVLMTWLGGQAHGSAIADVLFGKRSPSGKLAETFARSASDHPSALNFPGGPRRVVYGEGIYVGYRYFATFDRAVAYPFGHGLSYTSFEYTGATAPNSLAGVDAFELSVAVRNTGSRRGVETVQVYARHLDPELPRPDRELLGFDKIVLEPGESTRVTIPLHPRDLAYWSDVYGRWVVEPGRYEIAVGSSSADIRATLPLLLETGDVPPRVFTLDDVFGDIVEDPQGKVLTDLLLHRFGRGPLDTATEDDHFAAMLRNLPFRKIGNFSGGAISRAASVRLLELVNSDLPPDQVPARAKEILSGPRRKRRRLIGAPRPTPRRRAARS